MAFQSIVDKKFLDATGTSHLWSKIKERYDTKIDSVAAEDDSIVVSNSREIQVQISADPTNLLQLKTTGNKGLYVDGTAGGNNDVYSMVKAADSGDYAAVYQLMRYTDGQSQGAKVGVDINIPKDMVVQSGTVETKSTSGPWGNEGTYIHLVLANTESSDLYIAVDSLVEYVTSGSQTGDMVMIVINPTTHQVTAYLSDDSVTASKLAPAVRQQIAQGVSAVHSVVEGSTNGTIEVDGTPVAVHGLGTAAYTASTSYDQAGAAATVMGTDQDSASTMSVYGTKKYASNAYASIVALTNAEIDAAIAAANI